MTKERVTTVVGGTEETVNVFNSMKIGFASCRGKLTSIEIENVIDILKRVKFDESDKDDSKDIVVPSYQRNQLKDDNKKFVPSLFASIILGIGVPSSIIIALNEEGKKELVDALQRLSALFDIYYNNIPFDFKKIDKRNFTDAEIEYLKKFDKMTFADFKDSNKDIYDYMKDLKMATYYFEGYSKEERIYLFYKFNASSAKLSKDEMNHALFEGTALYKLATSLSKRVDNEDGGDRIFRCMQRLVNSDIKFVRTNYILKIAYTALKEGHLQDESYSTGFSKVLIGDTFLASKDTNNQDVADSILGKIVSTFETIENYGLLNIKDKISLTPIMSEDTEAMKKDASKKATFCFLCLFYFALQYGDTIKKYGSKSIKEDGVDIFDVFSTYINQPGYKTSVLATENYQHTDTVGKVFVNAYVWNEMLKHAVEQEDYHETFSDFDFSAKYAEARVLCANGRRRKKNK